MELAKLKRHQLAHKRKHIKELELKAKNEVLELKPCPFCDKHFRPKSLSKHIDTIHRQIARSDIQKDKILMCPYCDKEFKEQKGLFEHKKKVHSFGKFECKKCGLQLPFAKELCQHVLQQGHDDVPLICPSCNGQQKVDEMEMHYEECIKMNVNEKLLFMQQRYEHEISQNMSQRMDSTEDKKINDGNQGGLRERICPYCSKSFMSHNQTLLNHKKLEHFWGKFWCPKCNLLVFNATDLINHMLETKHDQDNALVKCPACSLSFEISQIKSHYESCVVQAHREKIRARKKKQKMCLKCGKIFATDQYYQHMKMHLRAEGVTEEETNLKLYHHCDKCTKYFASKQGLMIHQKTTHEGIKVQTKPKPTTVCTDCGEKFKGQTALDIHMNLNHIKDGKYQCKICGKPNGNTTQLSIHMVKHEEPKFKCSYCGKMFKFQNTLDAHERGHRGEKPYPCSLCSASFSGKSSIDQHMKGVHKIIGPQGGKTGWWKK